MVRVVVPHSLPLYSVSPHLRRTQISLFTLSYINLSASSISFPCGRVEFAARWASGGNTYRSWRKGRGFTGMNCDNDVSWPSYLDMAVGSGPTHTHDGQAAGCLGEWVLQQKRSSCYELSVRRFCLLLWFVARDGAGKELLLHGQRNFGRAGIWVPRGWRLNDGSPLLTKMYLLLQSYLARLAAAQSCFVSLPASTARTAETAWPGELR